MGCCRAFQYRSSPRSYRSAGPNERRPNAAFPRLHQQGIRDNAENLCTAQLGFRTELDALEAERREVDALQITSLDRRIAKEALGLDGDGTFEPESLPP